MNSVATREKVDSRWTCKACIVASETWFSLACATNIIERWYLTSLVIGCSYSYLPKKLPTRGILAALKCLVPAGAGGMRLSRRRPMFNAVDVVTMSILEWLYVVKNVSNFCPRGTRRFHFRRGTEPAKET